MIPTRRSDTRDSVAPRRQTLCGPIALDRERHCLGSCMNADVRSIIRPVVVSFRRSRSAGRSRSRAPEHLPWSSRRGIGLEIAVHDLFACALASTSSASSIKTPTSASGRRLSVRSHRRAQRLPSSRGMTRNTLPWSSVSSSSTERRRDGPRRRDVSLARESR